MKLWRKEIGLTLTAAALFAGPSQARADETRTSGSVYFVREGEAAFIRLNANGKPVASTDLSRRPTTLRPTPAGTALGWDLEGVFEIRPDGKILWQLAAGQIDEGDLVVQTADPLPNGNILVLARSRTAIQAHWKAKQVMREQAAQMTPNEAKKLYAQQQQSPGLMVAEVDRSGRLVRHLDVFPYVSNVRAVGNDRMLWVSGDRVIEVDWEGKEIASFSPREKAHCYDALKLSSGNVLMAVDISAVARATGEIKEGRAGLVCEYDPSGKLLWSGSFYCPRGVQALPNGNVLVKAG